MERYHVTSVQSCRSRRAGCWLLPPLLPPPALRELRHRGLACRLVAVRRCAIPMMSKGERPHPRRALRCRVHLHDAADNNGIREHVVIVLVPLARWAGGRGALADQSLGHVKEVGQAGVYLI